jgi:exosome complex RNA-binding protein Rrp4
MSIHGYIWLCIENEEEVTVEEEEIYGTEPDSPTTQGKPRCICHLLAILNLYRLI